MRMFRPVVVLGLCVLASACATPRGNDTTAAEAAPQVVEATAVDATAVDVQASEAATPQVVNAPAPDVATDDAVVDEEQTLAESDFAAIYGTPGKAKGEDGASSVTGAAVYDPWEKYNRHVHDFNTAADRAFVKPLAKAYAKVLPRPVRTGIGNFFSNLGEPITAVNSLLQGNPTGTANAIGRMLVNTTIGLGGLFDVASKLEIPSRGEDFGQTLAVWGWKQSRYLEVPFMGPRTVRDMFGLLGDAPLRAIAYVHDNEARLALSGLQATDLRARLLAVEALVEQGDTVDDYTLYRDIWMQRRNYHIGRTGKEDENGHHEADSTLPPYMFPGGTVPGETPDGE